MCVDVGGYNCVRTWEDTDVRGHERIEMCVDMRIQMCVDMGGYRCV